MPWTLTDREAISQYLGHPFQPDTLAVVETQMDRLMSLSAQGVVIAQGYLARITAIAADIDSASTKNTGGVIASADEDAPVEYASGQPLFTLREEGWRYVNLLGDLMQLSIYKNYFDVPTTNTAIDGGNRISQVKRS